MAPLLEAARNAVGPVSATTRPSNRRLSMRADVDEDRVVDPQLEVVRVYRRAGAGFARPVELSRQHGDALTTPSLPGLELPLPRICVE